MALKSPIVHLLALLTATLLVLGTLTIIKVNTTDAVQKEEIIAGNQKRTRGVYGNLTEGETAEIDFIASIKNPNQLTIFGSSEFGDSPYCPYNFLPDTLGFATLGIGHAHHQCFSILAELLVVQEYLQNSKICIVISPSWFHTPGTNTEAFVEFVRPNFLSKIRSDQNIHPKYKAHIGKFIHEHYDEFTSVTMLMQSFIDVYKMNQTGGLNYLHGQLREKMKGIHPNTYANNKVEYRIDTLVNLNSKIWTVNQENYLRQLQQEFISSITNNHMYVYDEYYAKYVCDTTTGLPKTDSISVINLENNDEFEDFKLLVDLLTENKSNCSFIIQPMNPYYYQHVDRNKPLIDSLTNILDKNQIPYLNMYSLDKDSYEPGTLKDIMHLGDYGWMKINFFLDSVYYDR